MRVRPAILACTLLLQTAVTRTSSPAQPANQPTTQPARQTAPVPTLKVYTRETIVDITVTDAKGNPVHGLTRDVFTVKEDNKPQTIRSFHEYGSEPVAAPAQLPPGTYTNIQPPSAGAALNILLLDFLNAAPIPSISCCIPGDASIGPEELHLATRAENLVRKEAEKYVSSMPIGTRVSVLGMGQALRILQGFTSDPVLLSAAIDTMPYDLDGRADTGPQACAQAEMRNRETMEVLNQIAADAIGIKGRKNLLWFTVGVPSLNNPGERPKCLPDYESDIFKTYGLLAAAEITLYPIDARGIPPMPSYITGLAVAHWQQRVGTEQLAMEAWAEQSGGEAFYNSNDLAASIAKAVDKGSSYYTLTYSPPGQKYNWAHHNINVALAATAPPGLHLVYRKTYDAVDPAIVKLVPGLTLALTPGTSGPPKMYVQMTRAMPTSDALPFDVKVEPDTEPAKPDTAVIGILSPKLQGKPLTRYTLQYAILGSGIALPKGQGGLEFDLAAYDTDGNLVTSLRQAIKLNLAPNDQIELASAAFPYTEQLDLPSGQLFLRVGVLDRTSNKLGTLEIPLTVPKK
jgi:VWFA-related protein